MEVKINKEIREYTESVAFGLSLRQCFFSVSACVIAIIIYFSFKNTLGIEATTWACLIGALPSAAFGFIKFQGMSTERIVIEAIRSFFLTQRRLIYQPINLYYISVQCVIKKHQKEEMINNDKNLIKITKVKQRWLPYTKKCTRYR